MSTTLYLRETNNARWGYVKSSQKLTGTPGQQFAVILVCRNKFPYELARRPYMRIAIITNPLSAWEQIHRLQYTIPPTNQWHSFVYNFTLQASSSVMVDNDETEFRIYARLYGDSTHYDLAALQTVETDFAATALSGGILHYHSVSTAFAVGEDITGGTSGDTARVRNVTDFGNGCGVLRLVNADGNFQASEALTGDLGGAATTLSAVQYKAADVLTETWSTPLKTTLSAGRVQNGVLAPAFGSQMPITQTLMSFTCAAGKDITKIDLKYKSRENFTLIEQVTPSLFAQAGEGEFVLEWTDADGSSSAKIFEDEELNHLRVTRTLLWDTVHWCLQSRGGVITFGLWFYGLNYEKSLNGSAEITGYTSNGGGAIYSDSILTLGAIKGSAGTGAGGGGGSTTDLGRDDWYTRDSGEKRQWRRL